MPEPSKPADRTRVLSVRLTDQEFEALAARATEVGVGPSTLARTLVRSALALGASDSTDTSASSRAAEPPRTPQPATGAARASVLEAQLLLGLAARIETLERWVADHPAET